MPPTFQSLTDLSNSLKRMYPAGFFEAAQQKFTPTMDELDECPDKPTEGIGLFFPFFLSTPRRAKFQSPGSLVGGAPNARIELQGQVNAVEQVDYIQLTEMVKNAGTAQAAWNGGEFKRQVKEATEDITKLAEQAVNISHGTVRLCTVQNATVASTSFVAANDEGVSNLMENDLVDVFNLDSGGAIQFADVKILEINRTTREVLTNTSMTLTAGWGIYTYDSYGIGINGFHGLIDNGVFQDSIHGQSRAASGQAKLKSQVVTLGTPGVPADISSSEVIKLLDTINDLGGEVDMLAGNVGVLRTLFQEQEGNKRYNIEAGSNATATKLRFGFKEGDWLFNYYRGDLRVRRGRNLPYRTFYAYSLKKTFWKHTLRKVGWLEGSNGILHLTPGDGGFYTAWTGIIMQQFNVSCRIPAWNGVVRNAKDYLAGDV